MIATPRSSAALWATHGVTTQNRIKRETMNCTVAFSLMEMPRKLAEKPAACLAAIEPAGIQHPVIPGRATGRRSTPPDDRLQANPESSRVIQLLDFGPRQKGASRNEVV